MTDASISFDYDKAFANLVAAADELRRAEQVVEERKAALLAAVPVIDDRDAARRFAVEAYWSILALPTRPLAELATGLKGGKAQYAFMQISGTQEVDLHCCVCGEALKVRSRQAMARVMGEDSAKNRFRCEACVPPEPERGPAVIHDRDLTNPAPDAFKRELLRLHLDRGQSATIDALGLRWSEALVLSPGHIALYLQDPDLGIAAARGVSREDYREWLESDGCVSCSARTRTGAACRNGAAGLYDMDLDLWMRVRQTKQYCTVHA